MKDELIKLGYEKGLNKEMLENKYKEYFDIINKQINNPDISTKKATIQLKGFIKGLLGKPTETITALVLGDSVTDFGAIMRRKYPEGVYPEGHFNVGKEIPEHEYSKKILLFDIGNNKLLNLTLNHNDVNEFDVEAGTMISITISKGYKEGMFFFDKNLANIEIKQELSYNEVKSYIVDKLKPYIANKLTDLKDTPNNELVVVNAETIVDVRAVFDNAYVNIDDMSLGLDLKVEIMTDMSKVKFYPGSTDVIFIAEKIKSNDKSVTLKAYSCFANEQYDVKAEEIKEDNVSEEEKLFK